MNLQITDFKVNRFITVRLEKEKTIIYIADEKLRRIHVVRSHNPKDYVIASVRIPKLYRRGIYIGKH